jgi:hypothetical protein
MNADTKPPESPYDGPRPPSATVGSLSSSTPRSESARVAPDEGVGARKGSRIGRDLRQRMSGSNGTLLEPTNHPTRRVAARLGARTSADRAVALTPALVGGHRFPARSASSVVMER